MSLPQETWETGPLHVARIVPRDRDFMVALLSIPALSAHKPVPVPDTPDRIAARFTSDLDHWARHGVGRWCVRAAGQPVGLCGLTHRAGFPGLNLSYHLSPDHWGKGWASLLAAGMVGLCAAWNDGPDHLHALVRAANPASARVIEKAGFRRTAEVMLGGAPSKLWMRGFGRDAPGV